MKRFMIATAMTLSMSTAAFAATDAEIASIQQYMPDANVAAWSDADVAAAMNVISGNESRSTIVSQLNALYGAPTATSPAMITEEEKASLDQYVTGVDYSKLPQATVDAALAASTSEMSASDREARVTAILTGDATPMGSEGNTATAAEVATINAYAPSIDVSSLTDAEVNTAMNVIYSEENRDDVASRLESLFN
ncbi:hypothetical protein [Litorisediminicola beolgyonensis]|uniref:DUF2059 domain-containing protein n=1 Tax=Litorisediminicola beolgyonensis TaxID=1173614 RepID=A0ABW3ZNJ0_9RHOB